jgi:hypothetical protein
VADLGACRRIQALTVVRQVAPNHQLVVTAGNGPRQLAGLPVSGDTGTMGADRVKSMSVKKLPTCAAILLCDSVIRDEVTHKTSVIGIFDTFYVESLPGQTSRCAIFLRLVDGVGRFAITAEVHDPARGVVLFRSPGAGEFGNPTEKTSEELWLPVAPLMFEQDGGYDLVVFTDEIEVGRVQFKIRRPDS